MTSKELATCTVSGIPIKVAVINNGSLGMVRQLQSLYYDGRISNIDLGQLGGRRVPDFPKLADAYGAIGLVCDSPSDVDATIEKAMKIDDVPVVIDFRVRPEEMVWPAIADGASNDAIRFARGLTPDFDEDDL
jgi:acetolactate synthase-1/2/3 large subunit